MNKGKLIDADKLKEEITKRWMFTPESLVFKLIDELSEDREDDKPKCVNGSDIINPLKVAIKGDGTEEYGKKIIEYFNKIGTNCLNVSGVNGNRYYYLDEEKDLWFRDSLPEGYTEISLKEESWIDKDKRLFPTLESRVEELEKELTEIKLKLKDLSK